MNYEPVIGLEVHIELATRSKMFCSCSANYFGTKPNTHTCPICLGFPGAMPKANKLAIEFTQKLALALDCQLRTSSKFDRKNYFYPDLPKGFQISQFELPFSQKGFLNIQINGKTKRINITRVHLEEDTGKLTHTTINERRVTLIDFNRSGVPLIEIVSEPDIRSAQEVKAYAQKLQQIARYLKISDADMEKGSMRIEPNVSLRKTSNNNLPTYKVELKNINSFRFAERAINFEIERQIAILEKRKLPQQETRGWNEILNKTVSQRSKEFAHDYRYFPEPDLPPLIFKKDYLESLKEKLPELPEAKKERFANQYQLARQEAIILTTDSELATFFEEAYKSYRGENRRKIINWIIQELLRRLNQSGKKINQIPLLPAQIAELQILVDQDQLNLNTAKIIFEKMFKSGQSPRRYLDEHKTETLTDEKLNEIIEQILIDNDKAINDYKKGKKGSLEFLIGQVQKVVKNQADANKTRQVLLSKLTKSN